MRLLETMRAEGGRVALLDAHLARLGASAAHFGFPFDAHVVHDEIARALREAEPAPVHRVRLTLAADVQAEAAPLDGTPFATVWLCPDPLEEAGGPLCVHKTTARAHYEAPFARARAAGADEAILVGADGQIVEGSRTSVWARLGGVWCTPPLAAGGLPGVARAAVLATLPGAVEARLEPDDLRAAEALAVSNALLGFCRVRLIAGAGEPPVPRPPSTGLPLSPLRS